MFPGSCKSTELVSDWQCQWPGGGGWSKSHSTSHLFRFQQRHTQLVNLKYLLLKQYSLLNSLQWGLWIIKSQVCFWQRDVAQYCLSSGQLISSKCRQRKPKISTWQDHKRFRWTKPLRSHELLYKFERKRKANWIWGETLVSIEDSLSHSIDNQSKCILWRRKHFRVVFGWVKRVGLFVEAGCLFSAVHVAPAGGVWMEVILA